jgi:hypothetical protein
VNTASTRVLFTKSSPSSLAQTGEKSDGYLFQPPRESSVIREKNSKLREIGGMIRYTPQIYPPSSQQAVCQRVIDWQSL